MRWEVRVSDGHGPYRGWEDATMYVQCSERNGDSCPSETRQPTSPMGSHGPCGNVLRIERRHPSMGGDCRSQPDVFVQCTLHSCTRWPHCQCSRGIRLTESSRENSSNIESESKHFLFLSLLYSPREEFFPVKQTKQNSN